MFDGSYVIPLLLLIPLLGGLALMSFSGHDPEEMRNGSLIISLITLLLSLLLASVFFSSPDSSL